MKEIREEQITVLTAADLTDLDESRLGLKGSPTQVEKIFPPEKNTDKKVFRGTGEELADTLTGLLKEKKFV